MEVGRSSRLEPTKNLRNRAIVEHIKGECKRNFFYFILPVKGLSSLPSDLLLHRDKNLLSKKQHTIVDYLRRCKQRLERH